MVWFQILAGPFFTEFACSPFCLRWLSESGCLWADVVVCPRVALWWTPAGPGCRAPWPCRGRRGWRWRMNWTEVHYRWLINFSSFSRYVSSDEPNTFQSTCCIEKRFLFEEAALVFFFFLIYTSGIPFYNNLENIKLQLCDVMLFHVD